MQMLLLESKGQVEEHNFREIKHGCWTTGIYSWFLLLLLAESRVILYYAFLPIIFIVNILFLCIHSIPFFPSPVSVFVRFRHEIHFRRAQKRFVICGFVGFFFRGSSFPRFLKTFSRPPPPKESELLSWPVMQNLISQRIHWNTENVYAANSRKHHEILLLF